MAQPTAVSPRRMMLFWFDHNNLAELWPQRSVATTVVGSSGAREVPIQSLASLTSGSSVLSNARYGALRNAGQLTVLRGFDTAVAYGPGHGNFTLASGQGRESEGNYPTLDTVVEASPTVYPSSTPLAVRKALRVSFNGTLFYQKVGTSSVQPQVHYEGSSIGRFYTEVFSSLTNGTVVPPDMTNQVKSNILNRVHGSFSSFKNNRKISADDLARLDLHMGYISDLQRSFASVMPTPVSTCMRPAAPGNIGGNQAQSLGVYVDLMALAFKCGLTKFGTLVFDAHDPSWIPNMNLNGNVVHDCMHGSAGTALQRQAYEAWWRYNSNVIADRFLAPLEELEGDTGRSYLQNMVTGLVCVGGIHPMGGDGGHSGLDSQQILIGSMGGLLRSGRYMAMPRGPNGQNLPYNCFLLTLLNLMGMPASEYAFATPNGQGFGFYGEFEANHPFRSRYTSPITEILA